MRGVLALVLVMGCGDNHARPPDGSLDAPVVDAGVPRFAQTAFIKSTHPLHDANFGNLAMSADGNTLVVGARGAVTVYAHDTAWHVDSDLVPSLATVTAGPNVAISSDGSTVAFDGEQANGAGVVYVFRKTDGAWVQETSIADVNAIGDPIMESFGAPLAFSGNDLLLASSRGYANDIGQIRLYARGATGWSKVGSLGNAPGDFAFGQYVAASPDGSAFVTLGAGATDLEIYTRSEDDTWTLRGTIQAPDPNAFFGEPSLSCTDRCDRIVVGNTQFAAEPGGPTGAGTAYVFDADGAGSWALHGRLQASSPDVADAFGKAVAISRDGATILVGASREGSAEVGVGGTGANNDAPYSGAAYLFRVYLGAWTQMLYLKASNTKLSAVFGTSLAVSADGTTLVVSAPYEDSGASGIDGDQADESAPYAGAAYAFQGTF